MGEAAERGCTLIECPHYQAGYTKKFRDKLYDACQFCAKGEQPDEQTR